MSNKTLMKQIGAVKKSYEHFTLGFDPECFLTNSKGEIKSSIPILQRDKYNPIQINEKESINLFADNSLAEFNLKPATDKQELINRFKIAFQGIQSHLGKEHRILIQSAHYFKENELEAAYGIDPHEVGCTPEFNFYKQEMNELGAFENTMRSGSAHVHIGHSALSNLDDKEKALRLVEIFLGCSSVLWDNDKTAPERRKKYGTAGAFRPTSYGAESRFMSNYMLNSPSLIELTYDIVEYCMSLFLDGKYQKVIDSVKAEDVQKAINTCDKDLATNILTKAGLPEELFSRVKNEASKKYSTKDFYSNWGIKV